MPNIIEYTSRSGITPSDKGISAAENAAVMYQRTANKISGDISRTFNDIADKVERHMAIMETSELYKTGTELELNLQKLYEEESSRPENRGDPTFGDRFLAERVNPLLDQWGEGASTNHGKQLATSLKAGIRSKIFNHVAAGQAQMDAANVDDSVTQTGSNLAAGLALDPSEANLHRTIGTMDAAIDGMTAAISDVGMRERAKTEYQHKFLSELVMHRYTVGVGQAITNQIAETGGETSPALEQLNKDIENKLGFEYLSPKEQEAVRELGERAVSRGQELFNSRNATAKSKMTEEGKAAYAQIHSQITALALNGQGPTPDLIESAQQFAYKYGATNPGEAASLDSFIISGQDRAQRNAVQPFDQQTRDNIQAGFSLPKGDPRRPTLASLTKAYSTGLITKEDLSGYTQILERLDKPEQDPAFKAAWDQFVRWRDAQAAALGNPSAPGFASAKSRFINDVTNNFMAKGRASGNWEQTLQGVTDPNQRGSFANPTILGVYRQAVNKPPGWLDRTRGWPQWNMDNTLTWPVGTGGGRPAIPGPPPAPPGFAPEPAADLKKADEIIWGGK